MAKRICVVLGDQEYQIPRLNMGELEELTELMTDNGVSDRKRPYAVLALALRRAEPPVDAGDFMAIEATIYQVTDAVRVIFGHAGMQVETTESPPAPAAPAPKLVAAS